MNAPGWIYNVIILRILRAGRPLALHEFELAGVNENNLGSRLPELAKKRGLVVGTRRAGESFKEWDLTAAGRAYALDLAAKTAESSDVLPGAPA